MTLGGLLILFLIGALAFFFCRKMGAPQWVYYVVGAILLLILFNMTGLMDEAFNAPLWHRVK